jgi:DnaJ like chaperone protein
VALSWVGKVTGGVLGLVAAGPVGALVGALLGHQFDRGLADGKGGPGVFERLARGGSAPERTVFEATFRLMGRVAKADGRVSEAEIRAARAAMDRMRLTSDLVMRAISLYTEGKQPGWDPTGTYDGLGRVLRGRRDLARAFLELQVQVVVAAGELGTAERRVLWEIAQHLGLTRVEFVQLETLARTRHYRGRAPVAWNEGSLAAAYARLGVADGATNDEIKQAYRRLMSRHHPDKFATRGDDDAERQAAERATREIRAAYERVRRARGMR